MISKQWCNTGERERWWWKKVSPVVCGGSKGRTRCDVLQDRKAAGALERREETANEHANYRTEEQRKKKENVMQKLDCRPAVRPDMKQYKNKKNRKRSGEGWGTSLFCCLPRLRTAKSAAKSSLIAQLQAEMWKDSGVFLPFVL